MESATHRYLKTLVTSGDSGDMPENIGSNVSPVDELALVTSGDTLRCPELCHHSSPVGQTTVVTKKAL